MNPELQTKVFSWVSDAASKIADWSSREVPAFIQEYLQWKFAESLIHAVAELLWVVLAVAIFIGAIVIAKKLWKKLEEASTYDSDGEFLAFMFLGVLPVIATAIIVSGTLAHSNFTQSTMDCVQIKLAPKVYLVEKASEIIKSETHK